MNLDNITLDTRQKELVELLDNVFINLHKKDGFFSRLFNNNSSEKNNIYVYGDVGRGKTMIAKAFFDSLDLPKNYIHYGDFMRKIHSKSHLYYNHSKSHIMIEIAKQISAQYDFIVIDEFEIHDIADAMIIKNLFEALIEDGVNLFLTSNVKPDCLYKDGLQREGFLPFVDFLEEKFHIFSLNGDHDYRLDKIATDERIFYPLNSNSLEKISLIKREILGDHKAISKKIEIFGRDIVLKRVYKQILITDFDELCKANLSSNDFIKIAETFSVIIMENVPLIGKDDTDIAIRFINFVDNVYFHKVLLFISLADIPEKIYPYGKRSKEFKRTISRLHEINSNIYFKNSKHK